MREIPMHPKRLPPGMQDVEAKSSPASRGGSLRKVTSESLLTGLRGGVDWRDREDTLSLPAEERKGTKDARRERISRS